MLIAEIHTGIIARITAKTDIAIITRTQADIITMADMAMGITAIIISAIIIAVITALRPPLYRWNPQRPIVYAPHITHHRHYAPRYRVGHRFSNHQHYRITNYGHYGLYSPPRGHHWVRHDNDAYLTAIGTGIVAGIIVGAILSD